MHRPRRPEPTGEEHCCNDPAHMSPEYLAAIERGHAAARSPEPRVPHPFDHGTTFRHHHDADTGEPVWWLNCEQFGGDKREHRHPSHVYASPETPEPAPGLDAAFVCFRDGRWYLNVEGLDKATEIGPTDDDLYAMHDAVNGEEARSAEGRRLIAADMRRALAARLSSREEGERP